MPHPFSLLRVGAALVVFVHLSAGAASGAETDLVSLLRQARESNPELAAMRFEAIAASERVGQADALPDPRLRVELQDLTRANTQNPTLLPSQVGSTRYTLMQDLPWAGTRDLRRHAAEHLAQSAQQQTQALWLDLASRIKEAYAQLYALHRSEALLLQAQDQLQQMEQLALSRYAHGLAPQQDVLRAQAEQSELHHELLALGSEIVQTRGRLNALLARPAKSALPPPNSLPALPAPERLEFDALAEKMRSANPLLASEEQRVAAANSNSELVRKNRYPTITLGISPTQMQDSISEWGVMLEMNIPLQNAGRRGQEREAQALIDAARARRDNQEQQLLALLSEHLAALDAARHTEERVRDAQLIQARLTLDAALAGYETGRTDFGSVLEAQRQVRAALQAELMAQTEGRKRLAQIERLIGEEL